MFGEQLLLAALHLIVVIDVAALTLALGIEESLASMSTISGERASTILVVAVVAHAMSVER